MTNLLARLDFAFAARCVGKALRIGFLTAAALVEVRAVRFLPAGARAFSFRFADASLVAFRARAFPAGERLVAGLSRVDFFPVNTRFRDPDPDEWRVADRELDLFVVTLMH